MTIDSINIVSPNGEHRFSGVTSTDENGEPIYDAYTAKCACGFEFTGPDKDQEPDINKRKDAAWSAIAEHFTEEVISKANKLLGEL